MADAVGFKAEEVGDGVVLVGAEVVDGEANDEAFELWYIQTPFSPGCSVVKIVGLWLFSYIC